MQESADFAQRAKHRRATLGEIYRSLLQNWAIVLRAVLLVTLTSVFFYMITAYTPTYARQVLGLSAMTASSSPSASASRISSGFPSWGRCRTAWDACRCC